MLDALQGVALSDADWRTIRWLAGWEAGTVERIAGMIERARTAGPIGDQR